MVLQPATHNTTKNILITKSSGMWIYGFISVREGLRLQGRPFSQDAAPNH
jgi:hypothetical protein